MLPASLKAKRTTDSPPLLTAYSGQTIQYKGVAEETINILRRSTPMKYFIGIDNSSIDHKVHIIDENCNKLKSFIITNDLSGFKELDNHLKRYKELYVGLELPHGPIIDFLRYKKYIVYSFNPLKIKRFKESYIVSGNKNDSIDAEAIAHYILRNITSLRALTFNSPEIENTIVLYPATRCTHS